MGKTFFVVLGLFVRELNFLDAGSHRANLLESEPNPAHKIVEKALSEYYLN